MLILECANDLPYYSTAAFSKVVHNAKSLSNEDAVQRIFNSDETGFSTDPSMMLFSIILKRTFTY